MFLGAVWLVRQRQHSSTLLMCLRTKTASHTRCWETTRERQHTRDKAEDRHCTADRNYKLSEEGGQEGRQVAVGLPMAVSVKRSGATCSSCINTKSLSAYRHPSSQGATAVIAVLWRGAGRQGTSVIGTTDRHSGNTVGPSARH